MQELGRDRQARWTSYSCLKEPPDTLPGPWEPPSDGLGMPIIRHKWMFQANIRRLWLAAGLLSVHLTFLADCRVLQFSFPAVRTDSVARVE